ncbi:DUF4325 domain-containing protein [Patescibacteria group bacterium]|nr:DUF4325 domain-containing protein [Patescibacteria group bacterium]
MTTKDTALKIIAKEQEISTRQLVEKTGVSRQQANNVINQLVKEGRLIRVGKPPHIAYLAPGHHKLSQAGFTRTFHNQDLKEHEILEEVKKELGSISQLPENIRSIFDYAFSEMLNNAIEHSKSKQIKIDVGREKDSLIFVIEDFGIGVFKNIMKKKKLSSPLEAIQDLLKGKMTTHPQAHSGEGIFFTSRVADLFILESFDYRLRRDNIVDDIFVEKIDPSTIKGTKVIFRINQKSTKHLSDVFKEYQTGNTELGFDKTEIKVKLYTMGTIYVSRSQARRILSGLDQFESIIMDFEKVSTIGQAFADEIFRVFKSKYPKKIVSTINTNEAVQFMIDRVAKITPTVGDS